jgi:hypothetical protein
LRILKHRTFAGHETDCKSGISGCLRFGLSISLQNGVLLLLLAYALMLGS